MGIEYEGSDIFFFGSDCFKGRPVKGEEVNFEMQENEIGMQIAKNVVGVHWDEVMDAAEDEAGAGEYVRPVPKMPAAPKMPPAPKGKGKGDYGSQFLSSLSTWEQRQVEALHAAVDRFIVRWRLDAMAAEEFRQQ